jgi:hypothetical protein
MLIFDDDKVDKTDDLLPLPLGDDGSDDGDDEDDEQAPIYIDTAHKGEERKTNDKQTARKETLLK